MTQCEAEIQESEYSYAYESSEEDEYDPDIRHKVRNRIGNIPDISHAAHPPYICPVVLKEQSQHVNDKQIEYVSQKLDQVLKKLTQNTIKKEIVKKTQTYLENKIRNIMPKCQVKAFGGAVNELSSINGDIDCTLIYQEDDIYVLEQKGIQAIVQNQELIKKISFPLNEYYTLIQQYSQANTQLAQSLQKGENAVYDNTLIYRRDRWRKVIIACLLMTAFDEEEIAECVLRARIPVIKLQLKLDNGTIITTQQYHQLTEIRKKYVTQLNIDLCVNNLLPLQNTMLIGEYMRQSSLVRELVLLIKEWANKREISLKNDIQMPNNYSFILLVIFYLQVTGVVDNLQESTKINIVCGYNCHFDRYDGKYYKYTIKELTQYFIGFFHFYGYDFSFDRAVISIRFGRALNRIEKQWFQHKGDISQQFKQFNKVVIKCEDEIGEEEQQEITVDDLLTKEFMDMIKIPVPMPIQNTQNTNLHFCIEDPFEMNLNVSRNVDKAACSQIRKEFRRGFSILKRRSQNPVEWLLFSPKIDELGAKGTNDKNVFLQMKKMQNKLDNGQAIHVIETKLAVKKVFKFTQQAEEEQQDGQ